MDKIALKNALYAVSPHNLGTLEDDKYRDAVDAILDKEDTPHTFEVSQRFPWERVADLLCNALEGGSNYWYMIEDQTEPEAWEKWGSHNEKHTDYPYLYPFNPGGALVFSVQSEERDPIKAKAEEAKRYTLDRDAIARGLQLWADDANNLDASTRTAHPTHWGNFINDNTDAETGDVFLQYCLFGKVIYG